MAFTNNLKKQVDLPIWEWCRFIPVASAAGTVACSSDAVQARYIYYNIAAGSNFWRYDTWCDSWQQLASPPTVPTSPCSMIYNAYHGYQGKVISATATTFVASGLWGSTLNGYTVRITAGTGAGQDRVISAVADNVVADAGVATAVSTTSLTDSTKAWAINQWAGYQMRITLGAGVQQVRRILYNTATVITFADSNLCAIDNQANNVLATALGVAAGSQSQYYIDSNTFTVPTWTVTPDNSSRFTIMSGGIWLIHGLGTAFGMQYYDVAADTWYYKTNQSGVISAGVILGTDICLEQMTESAGAFTTGTASSATSITLTNSSATMAVGRYQNYLVKITGGTGVGQQRTILNNTATVLQVARAWEVTPDNTSNYSIFADFDKIYVLGNGASATYHYSVESDQLMTGKQLDWGTARIGAVIPSGVNQQGIPITSITSATTTATVTTAIAHNLKAGDAITIVGDTSGNSAKFNITTTVATVTSTTVFTYTIVSASGASATFTAVSTTLLVDATKSWGTNALIGNIIQFSTGAAGATGITTNVQRRITANTATTITFASATTVVNGTSRYTIMDVKSLGADTSYLTAATNGYGVASSGSTTSLVDSSKNWATNQWSTGVSRRLRIYAGTGAGAEVAITSNNATTLNFSAQSFTPDTTSQYYVMDTFGPASSGSVTTLVDSAQNWGTNAWAGQRVKITAGTGVGQELAITSNTSTTLTFAVATAPDSTSTYAIHQIPTRGAGNGLIWAWGTSDTNTKGNYLISPRGGATATMDRYDVTTERWRPIVLSPYFETLTTGSMYAYDNANRIYFTKDATNRVYYYDVVNNIVAPSSTAPYAVGTAIIGNRMEVVQTADGLQYLYFMRHTAQEMYRVLIFW